MENVENNVVDLNPKPNEMQNVEVPQPEVLDAAGATLLVRKSTVEAVTEVFNLMGMGMYPGGVVDRVTNAKNFLRTLHQEALKAYEAHPSYKAPDAPKTN